MLGDSITSYNGLAAVSNLTIHEPAACVKSLRESMARTEAMIAKHDVQRSLRHFAVMRMDPCPDCGIKVTYQEGPPEAVLMCRHVADRFERRVSDAGEPPLGAMHLVVFGETRTYHGVPVIVHTH